MRLVGTLGVLRERHRMMERSHDGRAEESAVGTCHTTEMIAVMLAEGVLKEVGSSRKEILAPQC